MSVFTIARLTFKEASRRRILIAALALGLVFLAIYGLGFYYIVREDMLKEGIDTANRLLTREISSFLMTAGLYVVNFLTVMMTVLTSVDTISGEIATGTVHTVVSKPLRRWEVIAGKWLGFAGMLSLYLLLMAGGVMLIVYLVAGYIAPHPVRALLLMLLNALMLLSISLWGGTALSTLANGVLVFGMFGIAFMGGWIEQIGTFFDEPARTTAINVGILTSLIMPSEALWRRAAYEIQSPLLGEIGLSPFSAMSVPSLIMVVYSVGYLVVMVALAIRTFSRRDL